MHYREPYNKCFFYEKRIRNMLKLRKGCKVPLNEKLFEGYEKKDNYIHANVDSDKIIDVLNHFIVMHEEPLFFILELPTKLNDENIVQPSVIECLHKDVYYIDGCNQEEALTILLRIGELLVNDGLCSFGFGGHQSNNEIIVGKYNLISVFEKNQGFFDDFFEVHDIHSVEHLITAWDTFTEDYPGESERIVTDGRDVFDIPEMFKEYGMYFAEQREE